MPDVAVGGRWGVEQVLALAPDASSQRAARALAAPRAWHERGWSPGEGDGDTPSLWGLCQGSGRSPYQTAIDLAGPACRCSCPSRKVPCKHAIGLLLLWAGDAVPEGSPPPWVREWQASREARATRAQVRREATGPPDGQRAAKTAARRSARITAGLAELDRWLSDQVRRGLAEVMRLGYGHWDAMAARLIDAQAPGAASAVRRLAPAAIAGSPDRMLTELSLLRLLVAGHDRLDELPPELAATVRTRVGYPVATEDVLALAPVRDRWQVLVVHDRVEENLTTRRVWLRGTGTARPALVLSFAPPGQPLGAELVVGTEIDADLCFYPGATPLRAIVAGTHAPAEAIPTAAGALGIAGALREYAEALAGDPWLDRWPMLLAGVTPVRHGNAGWAVIDEAGDALPLLPAEEQEEPWLLVAVAGGRPVTLAGEWLPAGLRAMTAWTGEGLVRL